MSQIEEPAPGNATVPRLHSGAAAQIAAGIVPHVVVRLNIGANMIDVLIVDDESISRRMIAYTLSQAGYNVTSASDGESAFRMLEEHGHQLVVSDWDMPGMNGIELCRAIRAADFPRYVYFIMLTSHNRSQDTIDGLSAGADDFIGKPFNPGELIMRANTGKRIIGLETRGMTIFALAKLAESRDPETGAHLERVRSYCRVLARRLQLKPKFRATLDNEYVQLIYDTSPLHDIGKVAIPDAILLKPGKLTEDEFDVDENAHAARRKHWPRRWPSSPTRRFIDGAGHRHLAS